MNLPSRLIDDAVSEFMKLPGIGRKTALRLVLHLLYSDPEAVEQFGAAILRMKRDLKFCRQCHNVSDDELCSICANRSRNHELVCVVEGLRDLIAIENTGRFNGLYHLLGGVVSPVDGIGPDDLNIDTLLTRVAGGDVKELLMALSPTMEGDTTIFYINKLVEKYDVKVTTLARGVAFGGDLEYVDDLTLGRSIAARLPYEKYLVNGSE
jgi:recombination protein RecR